MKNAPFDEIPVAADVKDDAATAARQRLSEALADLNPAAGFKGEGSGRGDKTKKKKSNEPETKPAPKTTETSPADADAAERVAKFDKLDKQKAGKITREYYTTHQSDAEAAGKRFDKFDTDHDGLLTRDEFIANGAEKKRAQ